MYFARLFHTRISELTTCPTHSRTIAR
jgi:hypothetical protein